MAYHWEQRIRDLGFDFCRTTNGVQLMDVKDRKTYEKINVRKQVREIVLKANVPNFNANSLTFSTIQHDIAYNFAVTLLRHRKDAEQVVAAKTVYNRAAWTRYEAEMKTFFERDGAVDERWLWYGTRSTDPQVICDDFNGFDITYAKEGYWGRGLYFASRAAYSMPYAFTGADGTRQLLLVRVLVGRSIRVGRNPQLQRPPQGYDSVLCDETPHSDNFVIYHSGARAYPSYIVSFAPF